MGSLTLKSVSIQDRPEIINYVIIGLVVLLFNLKSLGVHVIVLDDLAHYAEVVEGKFGYARFHRSLINPFLWYFFAKIMAYSAPMARAAILILVMLPLSFVMYYLCKNYLFLPKGLSIFCAILPQVLPGQAYIPTFVIGSYNSWALLIYLSAVLCFLKYLEKSNVAFLMGGILSYFGAVEGTETAIFLAAPLVVLIFWYRRFSRQHVFIILGILFVGAYKVVFVLLHPYSNVNAPRFLGVNEVLRRLQQMVTWDLPNPGMNASIALIMFLAVLALGLTLLVAKPVSMQTLPGKMEEAHSPPSERFRMFGLLLFAITWVTASILPFLASRYFSSRYAYILGFGLNFLFVLSIYSIFQRGRLKKYHVSVILLAILIVFVSLNRGEAIKKTFGPPDWVHDTIQKSLKPYNFPKESEIVIVGQATGYLFTGGYWNWSSGYIKYATKRSDLSGLIGIEKPFYDPFKAKERSYSFQMHGLDISKPLFLFRFHKGGVKPISYCLQWRKDEENPKWTIYSVNTGDGKVTEYASGNTRLEYEAVIGKLEKAGIGKRDVLWSG